MLNDYVIRLQKLFFMGIEKIARDWRNRAEHQAEERVERDEPRGFLYNFFPFSPVIEYEEEDEALDRGQL